MSRSVEPETQHFQRPERGSELIRFEKVNKAFGPKSIFENLDLSIREGETLTIIGGSGSGKSVLLKCLVGLMTVDSGNIVFQGHNLTEFSEEDFLQVRKRVAMVFQGAALFDSLSVGENIAYPLREHFPDMPQEEIDERVGTKLKLVNLPDTQHLMPSALSGGMRKRVGLARAIAIDPEVILWDEPTTGLDPVSTRMIDELMNVMNQELGCTSVVVTHDMESAFAVSDRIAMLADHHIAEVGTVEEIQNSKLPQVRAFLDARLRPKTLSRGAR